MIAEWEICSGASSTEKIDERGNKPSQKERKRQEARNKIEAKRQRAAKIRDRDLQELLSRKLDEHIAHTAAAKAVDEKEEVATRIKVA